MLAIKKIRYGFLWLFILLTVMQLSGCYTVTGGGAGRDGAPNYKIDLSKVHDAIPRVEPFSRYGNPASYVVKGHRYYVMHSNNNYHERGIASWYGTLFHKRRTSSGEPYDMLTMTAAHKTLPLPTYARVTNLQTGKQIIVKINDRGPFKPNRIIDLSYAAALKLGITGKGTGLVQLDTINPACWQPRQMRNAITTSMPVGRAHIYSQVGAFSSFENAQKLAQRIRQLTQEAVRVKNVVINGRNLFRVQVGPLHSVDEADQMHRRLSHLGFGEARTAIE